MRETLPPSHKLLLISAVPSSSSSVWNKLVILLLTLRIQALRTLSSYAPLASLSHNIQRVSLSPQSRVGSIDCHGRYLPELLVVACL
jgi:hypothetical protein